MTTARRDDAESDSRQIADGVHGDLRVVGARLNADVAERLVGVEPLARKGREVVEVGRDARPNRSLVVWFGWRRAEESGPNPMVSVRFDGGRPSVSPVSDGGV